jgi:Bifunctional DNA primase/polymerase, N-terminal
VKPYRDGAPIYLAKSWTGVLPLPPGKKKSPPKRYTGWNGTDPSAQMIETWRNETTGDYQGASNIGIRAPHNVVGIDVDHYDGKTGWDTLCQLEREICPLPSTYTSTARDDGKSGIRWFRVDTDEPLAWPTGPGKDIEFVHFGHRYGVVWPSIHPDTKEPYQWYDHAWLLSEPPEPDELAELPIEWVMRFTGGVAYNGSDPVEPATGEQISECLTDGEMCQAVAAGIRKYVDESSASKSHHDAMRDSIMKLVRLGEQRHRGVATAIRAVRTLFEQYAQGRDKYEVARAIDGAVAKVLANPTPEENKRCCGGDGSDPFGSVVDRSLHLPEEFWSSRPSLNHIRQAAHSKGRSADAVLYTTMARISATVSPLLNFDTCLGRGSLNFFVAIVGRSGRGKSMAVKIAKTLIHTPFALSSPEFFKDSMGIGSGEGIAELYMGMETYDTGEVYSERAKKAGQPVLKERRAKVRDNAFVYVDEGQTLSQQGKRQGNVILPTLRTAWTGDTLGQANASVDTTRHIPEGSYSLGMVIGYQKDTAQELIADVAPGTPQRLAWTSATDPAVPLQPPEHPGPLEFQMDAGARYIPRTGTITFYREINEELWKQNHERVVDEDLDDDELDSHEPLMLCKLSALLCIMEGRTIATTDDWALAKIMYQVSRNVMDDLVEYSQEKEQAKADAYAEAYANKEARGYLAKKNADANVARIARWIYGQIHDAGGITTISTVRHAVAGRDRPLLNEAIDHGITTKWFTTDGKKLAIGLEKPEP